jgi:hypothetical protein
MIAEEHMSSSQLPEFFHDLLPFVSEWALPTEQTRYAQRLSLTLNELRLFYDVILPRMDDIMLHLERFPADAIGNLPTDTLNLYRLALSYFEASHPIELKWKDVDLDDAFPENRLEYLYPSNVEN